jgi:hypothetical protein
MTSNEDTPTATRAGSTRSVSLGCYLLAAVAFAAIVFAIGLIPGYQGGGRAIRYQSFGYWCLALITIFLFDPGRPFSGIPFPSSWVYAPAIIVAVAYCLVVVLPTYFYFRTRRPWLLALQAAFLAAHAVFALYVVAPFWIGQ